MGVISEGEVHVLCPNCSKRLFDCDVSAEGTVSIKCATCKRVSVINLRNISMKQRNKRLEAYRKIAMN